MMYAPALVLMMIVGLAASACVAGIAGAAHAAIAIGANRALEGGLRDGLAAYERQTAATIAADVAGGAPSALLADPTTLRPATFATASGALTVRETVTPTTLVAPDCAADGAGTDRATALQCSPFVRETRASLRIDVDVLAADGATVIGHRSAIATLRLAALPPYAAVTGLKDTTQPNPTDADVADDASAPHEDDSAGRGAVPVAPDGAEGAAFSGPGDTAIHVQYRCLGSNCDQPRPPAPDALVDRSWTDGNRAAPSE